MNMQNETNPFDDMPPEEAELESITSTLFAKYYLNEIAFLRNAYKLLIKISKFTCDNPSEITSELNDYYKTLFNEVKRTITFLQKEVIRKKPYYLEFLGEEMFKTLGFDKPFANLFLAQREFQIRHQSSKLNWETISKSMYEFAGWLEQIYEWCGSKDNMIDSHRELLQKVSKYLKTLTNPSNKPFDFCRLDGDTFFITLHNGKEKAVSFETKATKNKMLDVFTILFKHWNVSGEKPKSNDEIKAGLLVNGYDIDEIGGDFVKNQIGNINKKFYSIKNVVSASYFNKGYRLTIKKPSS